MSRKVLKIHPWPTFVGNQIQIVKALIMIRVVLQQMLKCVSFSVIFRCLFKHFTCPIQNFNAAILPSQPFIVLYEEYTCGIGSESNVEPRNISNSDDNWTSNETLSMWRCSIGLQGRSYIIHRRQRGKDLSIKGLEQDYETVMALFRNKRLQVDLLGRIEFML